MSIFNRTIRPVGVEVVVSVPRPPGWAEAKAACEELGLDTDTAHVESLSVADFVRLAHSLGYKACESRLAARDVADGIAQAIGDPGSILERDGAGESEARWTVRAVQQVVAYGVPQ